MTAAIRTRSDGEWREGGHYSKLEIGRRVMNSLTRVAKDTLVIETYEQQERNHEDKIQQAGWHCGFVPQQQVEQRGGDEMSPSLRDNDEFDNGTESADNIDVCIL